MPSFRWFSSSTDRLGGRLTNRRFAVTVHTLATRRAAREAGVIMTHGKAGLALVCSRPPIVTDIHSMRHE